jgi:hypothetical protein
VQYTNFSINGPSREKRVITSNSNWSIPRGAIALKSVCCHHALSKVIIQSS